MRKSDPSTAAVRSNAPPRMLAVPSICAVPAPPSGRPARADSRARSLISATALPVTASPVDRPSTIPRAFNAMPSPERSKVENSSLPDPSCQKPLAAPVITVPSARASAASVGASPSAPNWVLKLNSVPAVLRLILPVPSKDRRAIFRSGRSNPSMTPVTPQSLLFAASKVRSRFAFETRVSCSVVSGRSTAAPSGDASSAFKANFSGTPSAATERLPFTAKTRVCSVRSESCIRPSALRAPLALRVTSEPKNSAYSGRNKGAGSPPRSALNCMAPSAAPPKVTLPLSRSMPSVSRLISAEKSSTGPLPLMVRLALGSPGRPNSLAAIPPSSSLASRSTTNSRVALE